MLTSKELTNLKTQAFLEACYHGDFSRVKASLEKDNEGNQACLEEENHLGFRTACEHGHLEIVSYLLSSPRVLKLHGKHADIHAVSDYALRWACSNGHLPIVEYLLTSPKVEEHADLSTHNYQAFEWACCHGNPALVSFLAQYILSHKTPLSTGQANALFTGFKEACALGHMPAAKAICDLAQLKSYPEFEDHAFLSFQRAFIDNNEEMMHFLMSEIDMPLGNAMQSLLLANPSLEPFFAHRNLQAILPTKEGHKARVKL